MADEASTTTGNTKTDAAFVERRPLPSDRSSRACPSPPSSPTSSAWLTTLTDTFYVGKLGTAASAASGVAMPVMVAIQAFGLLFDAGAGNKIAVLLGKKEHDADEEARHHGVLRGVRHLRSSRGRRTAAAPSAGARAWLHAYY